VVLVPALEVGGSPFTGRELEAQDIHLVVEITVEVEAADFDGAEARDSVGHAPS